MTGALRSLLRRREADVDLEDDFTAIYRAWIRLYFFAGHRGAWQAVHRDSLTVLGPVRTLDELAAALMADNSSRRSVVSR